MIYYILVSIIFGIFAVLPLDYLGGLQLFNEVGTFEGTINFTTTSILIAVGLAIGLLARYHEALLSHVEKMALYLGAKIDRQEFKSGFSFIFALFGAALINLVFKLLLGRLGYSLSLDVRYIGVGLLVSAIFLLFGAMIPGSKRARHDITVIDGLIAGVLSVMAIYPGVSYLAVVFMLLKLRKYDYKTIAEFSYLSMGLMAVNHVITSFIQYGSSFSISPSLPGSIGIMIGVAALAFMISGLYRKLVARGMTVLAVLSLLGGIWFVFFN